MFQIGLVPDQHDHDIGIRMIPQLLQPPTHIFKCRWLCNIVHEKSSEGTPIVCAGDCSVSLLSSRVPYLSFHSPCFD
ncbi:hypothetical protein OIU84_023220, partial [Salix udensis]